MRVRIDGDEIVFTDGSVGSPEQRRPLLSGYICPKCGEVLKVYFLTDEPVTVDDGPSWAPSAAKFRSFTAAGGQGIVSQTHRKYGSACTLEVFWAPSLTYNLIEWLRKNHEDRRFASLDRALATVRAGEVSGLVATPDVMGGDGCLLGFDEESWSAPWDYRGETYEQYKARSTQEDEAKLQELGVVSEK